MNDQQRRYLREREQQRAALVAELDALRGESDDVAISPDELRTRLEDIMQRYLGDDADTPEMRQGREQLYREYAALTDATARLKFFEQLSKSFGA